MVNWKDFLKPDWRKIVLTIIILIIAFLNLIQSMRGVCTRTHYNKFLCDLSMAFIQSPYHFILSIVIFYVISCLIVWIYEKYRSKKTSRKQTWIIIFIILIMLFFILLPFLIPIPPYPIKQPITKDECEGRFMIWCHQCLASNWSDDITIPSEILPCMQEYNPLNMLLTKDSTCRYVKPLCNYYGVE